MPNCEECIKLLVHRSSDSDKEPSDTSNNNVKPSDSNINSNEVVDDPVGHARIHAQLKSISLQESYIRCFPADSYTKILTSWSSRIRQQDEVKETRSLLLPNNKNSLKEKSQQLSVINYNHHLETKRHRQPTTTDKSSVEKTETAASQPSSLLDQPLECSVCKVNLPAGAEQLFFSVQTMTDHVRDHVKAEESGTILNPVPSPFRVPIEPVKKRTLTSQQRRRQSDNSRQTADNGLFDETKMSHGDRYRYYADGIASISSDEIKLCGVTCRDNLQLPNSSAAANKQHQQQSSIVSLPVNRFNRYHPVAHLSGQIFDCQQCGRKLGQSLFQHFHEAHPLSASVLRSNFIQRNGDELLELAETCFGLISMRNRLVQGDPATDIRDPDIVIGLRDSILESVRKKPPSSSEQLGEKKIGDPSLSELIPPKVSLDMDDNLKLRIPALTEKFEQDKAWQCGAKKCADRLYRFRPNLLAMNSHIRLRHMPGRPCHWCTLCRRKIESVLHYHKDCKNYLVDIRAAYADKYVEKINLCFPVTTITTTREEPKRSDLMAVNDQVVEATATNHPKITTKSEGGKYEEDGIEVLSDANTIQKVKESLNRSMNPAMLQKTLASEGLASSKGLTKPENKNTPPLLWSERIRWTVNRLLINGKDGRIQCMATGCTLNVLLDENELKRHIKSHCSTLPYVCPICVGSPEMRDVGAHHRSEHPTQQTPLPGTSVNLKHRAELVYFLQQCFPVIGSSSASAGTGASKPQQKPNNNSEKIAGDSTDTAGRASTTKKNNNNEFPIPQLNQSFGGFGPTASGGTLQQSSRMQFTIRPSTNRIAGANNTNRSPIKLPKIGPALLSSTPIKKTADGNHNNIVDDNNGENNEGLLSNGGDHAYATKTTAGITPIRSLPSKPSKSLLNMDGNLSSLESLNAALPKIFSRCTQDDKASYQKAFGDHVLTIDRKTKLLPVDIQQLSCQLCALGQGSIGFKEYVNGGGDGDGTVFKHPFHVKQLRSHAELHFDLTSYACWNAECTWKSGPHLADHLTRGDCFSVNNCREFVRFFTGKVDEMVNECFPILFTTSSSISSTKPRDKNDGIVISAGGAETQQKLKTSNNNDFGNAAQAMSEMKGIDSVLSPTQSSPVPISTTPLVSVGVTPISPELWSAYRKFVLELNKKVFKYQQQQRKPQTSSTGAAMVVTLTGGISCTTCGDFVTFKKSHSATAQGIETHVLGHVDPPVYFCLLCDETVRVLSEHKHINADDNHRGNLRTTNKGISVFKDLRPEMIEKIDGVVRTCFPLLYHSRLQSVSLPTPPSSGGEASNTRNEQEEPPRKSSPNPASICSSSDTALPAAGSTIIKTVTNQQQQQHQLTVMTNESNNSDALKALLLNEIDDALDDEGKGGIEPAAEEEKGSIEPADEGRTVGIVGSAQQQTHHQGSGDAKIETPSTTTPQLLTPTITAGDALDRNIEEHVLTNVIDPQMIAAPDGPLSLLTPNFFQTTNQTTPKNVDVDEKIPPKMEDTNDDFHGGDEMPNLSKNSTTVDQEKTEGVNKKSTVAVSPKATATVSSNGTTARKDTDQTTSDSKGGVGGSGENLIQMIRSVLQRWTNTKMVPCQHEACYQKQRKQAAAKEIPANSEEIGNHILSHLPWGTFVFQCNICTKNRDPPRRSSSAKRRRDSAAAARFNLIQDHWNRYHANVSFSWTMIQDFRPTFMPQLMDVCRRCFPDPLLPKQQQKTVVDMDKEMDKISEEGSDSSIPQLWKEDGDNLRRLLNKNSVEISNCGDGREQRSSDTCESSVSQQIITGKSVAEQGGGQTHENEAVADNEQQKSTTTNQQQTEKGNTDTNSLSSQPSPLEGSSKKHRRSERLLTLQQQCSLPSNDNDIVFSAQDLRRPEESPKSSSNKPTTIVVVNNQPALFSATCNDTNAFDPPRSSTPVQDYEAASADINSVILNSTIYGGDPLTTPAAAAVVVTPSKTQHYATPFLFQRKTMISHGADASAKLISRSSIRQTPPNTRVVTVNGKKYTLKSPVIMLKDCTLTDSTENGTSGKNANEAEGNQKGSKDETDLVLGVLKKTVLRSPGKKTKVSENNEGAAESKKSDDKTTDADKGETEDKTPDDDIGSSPFPTVVITGPKPIEFVENLLQLTDTLDRRGSSETDAADGQTTSLKTGNPQRPICNLCSAQMDSADDIEPHLGTHLNLNLYQCLSCGAQLKSTIGHFCSLNQTLSISTPSSSSPSSKTTKTTSSSSSSNNYSEQIMLKDLRGPISTKLKCMLDLCFGEGKGSTVTNLITDQGMELYANGTIAYENDQPTPVLPFADVQQHRRRSNHQQQNNNNFNHHYPTSREQKAELIATGCSTPNNRSTDYQQKQQQQPRISTHRPPVQHQNNSISSATPTTIKTRRGPERHQEDIITLDSDPVPGGGQTPKREVLPAEDVIEILDDVKVPVLTTSATTKPRDRLRAGGRRIVQDEPPASFIQQSQQSQLKPNNDLNEIKARLEMSRKRKLAMAMKTDVIDLEAETAFEEKAQKLATNYPNQQWENIDDKRLVLEKDLLALTTNLTPIKRPADPSLSISDHSSSQLNHQKTSAAGAHCQPSNQYSPAPCDPAPSSSSSTSIFPSNRQHARLPQHPSPTFSPQLQHAQSAAAGRNDLVSPSSTTNLSASHQMSTPSDVSEPSSMSTTITRKNNNDPIFKIPISNNNNHNNHYNNLSFSNKNNNIPSQLAAASSPAAAINNVVSSDYNNNPTPPFSLSSLSSQQPSQNNGSRKRMGATGLAAAIVVEDLQLLNNCRPPSRMQTPVPSPTSLPSSTPSTKLLKLETMTTNNSDEQWRQQPMMNNSNKNLGSCSSQQQSSSFDAAASSSHLKHVLITSSADTSSSSTQQQSTPVVLSESILDMSHLSSSSTLTTTNTSSSSTMMTSEINNNDNSTSSSILPTFSAFNHNSSITIMKNRQKIVAAAGAAAGAHKPSNPTFAAQQQKKQQQQFKSYSPVHNVPSPAHRKIVTDKTAALSNNNNNNNKNNNNRRFPAATSALKTPGKIVSSNNSPHPLKTPGKTIKQVKTLGKIVSSSNSPHPSSLMKTPGKTVSTNNSPHLSSSVVKIINLNKNDSTGNSNNRSKIVFNYDKSRTVPKKIVVPAKLLRRTAPPNILRKVVAQKPTIGSSAKTPVSMKKPLSNSTSSLTNHQSALVPSSAVIVNKNKNQSGPARLENNNHSSVVSTSPHPLASSGCIENSSSAAANVSKKVDLSLTPNSTASNSSNSSFSFSVNKSGNNNSDLMMKSSSTPTSSFKATSITTTAITPQSPRSQPPKSNGSQPTPVGQQPALSSSTARPTGIRMKLLGAKPDEYLASIRTLLQQEDVTVGRLPPAGQGSLRNFLICNQCTDKIWLLSGQPEIHIENHLVLHAETPYYRCRGCNQFIRSHYSHHRCSSPAVSRGEATVIKDFRAKRQPELIANLKASFAGQAELERRLKAKAEADEDIQIIYQVLEDNNSSSALNNTAFDQRLLNLKYEAN